ncbi:MAG: CDP-diacylglycerol--glycerol-3-phosphate 3-phosphatidyltransferase [Chthoniobacterales bacterium]|nr:CDP-diacylglycerol--glycerol-3-phosphate 3-phosphatidyltransferase [Chthoniobacterales bacterium]
MNLSNALTLLRLVLTIVFVMALSIFFPWSHLIALGTFALAAVTDWLDGYVARRYAMCTNFGRLMDPLADKILVASALIALIPFHAFPPWVVILIIGREFLVTGFRLLAMDQGILLEADPLGKQKTVWQLIAILFYLFLLAAHEFLKTPWITWAWQTIGPCLIAVALVMTLFSGGVYLWKYRSVLR